MKTPIKSISDDQNEITHESGKVSIFIRTNNIASCAGCVYEANKESCKHAECVKEFDSKIINGIFIEKKVIAEREGKNKSRLNYLNNKVIRLEKQLAEAIGKLPTSKEWREFTLYKESKK